MTRTRDEIELDLPFHVNGTLDAETTAEIDALLADDALLRAEHAALSAIRAEMQAEEVRSPGDFGLARLMRDVERSEAAPGQVAAAPRAANRTWMWQAAAAVAVVALLGQNVLMGTRPEAPPPSPGFELASAADAMFEATAAELVVTFAPDATEAQIRDLLVTQGLEIVSGPTALGLYHLTILEGIDRAAAIEGLRTAQQIVESVENVEN